MSNPRPSQYRGGPRTKLEAYCDHCKEIAGRVDEVERFIGCGGMNAARESRRLLASMTFPDVSASQARQLDALRTRRLFETDARIKSAESNL